MTIFASWLAGVIFGLGLIVSGMADPAKVLGFLDLAGAWDPSLAFVMAGAISVAAVAFAVARKRTVSFLGAAMNLPKTRRIDRRLVAGSLMFGIGWGVAASVRDRAWSRLGWERSRRWFSSWPCSPAWDSTKSSNAASSDKQTPSDCERASVAR